MKLYLCEKHTQGRDIGAELKTTKQGDGFLTNADGSVVVTWGAGHLVEQFSPEQYDPALKKWTLEMLPIIPDKWYVSPQKEKIKQYKIVMSLIKKASVIIISTDADREGEMIARELLELAGYRGAIQRLWLSALDDVSIRKALHALKPAQETLPLYYAGLARSRADWLVGMNFSRLFTLLARQKGYQGVLSVGRVQTPTLALVVQRDREIAHFVVKNHYSLLVQMSNQTGQSFMAQYILPEEHCDEDGLCLNAAVPEQAARAIQQAGTAGVLSVETKREKESPPLLFSLSKLQIACNRLFGFDAQQVLDIAQALYETHKATTYPRTDCGYLPESQFAEVPKVIRALIAAEPQLKAVVAKLDFSLKSGAWNDKEITAHHGIIPTFSKVDISKMNENELKVYQLIRLHYLFQFMPPCETDKTVAVFESAGHKLIARGNVMIKPGWKSLSGQSQEENEDTGQGLPPLNVNQLCNIINTEVKALQTRPPKPYNDATLLSAMINAARFVTDPRLKQQLRETKGLGTEATRAPTIESLFKRGYLVRKGKYISASAEGVALINSLPDVLKDPGLTALWEQALNQIAEGTLSLDSFMQKQSEFIRFLIKQCMQQGMQMGNIEVRKCPACGKPMRKIKHDRGTFWGCTGYPECQHKEADKAIKQNAGSHRKKQGSRNVSVSNQLKQLRQHLN